MDNEKSAIIKLADAMARSVVNIAAVAESVGVGTMSVSGAVYACAALLQEFARDISRQAGIADEDADAFAAAMTAAARESFLRGAK